MVSDRESLTHIEHNVSGLLSSPRVITLLGSILVALSAGTNYVFSAYAPQLGARLHISHTQLNVVGLAANFGIYVSGPIWGRIVDSRGPRIPLTTAFVCFLVGYAGMKRMYDEGTDSGTSISPAHFALLVICSLLTGLGANAGLASAVNSTAKSFPEWARATTVSLVFSGLGLSAFLYSTVTNILFPGDTSAFLLLLALTTSVSALVALLAVRPVPLPPTRLDLRNDDHGGHEHIPRARITPFIAVPDIDTVSVAEGDSRTPLLGVRPEYRSSSASEMEDTRSRSKPDNSPDIHGSMLWSTPDFYLVCTIMSLLSGTGIMCSISLALFAESNPNYDEVEASKWQAAQVSTLSVGNFAGRLLIGLISDLMRNQFHLPRACCLCIVSSLFVVSQALAIEISSVSMLWVATALLGVAYGGLFGALPTIVIDWFGLAHLSENWGYVTLAPLIGGNVFSIMLGRDLDAHTPREVTNLFPGVKPAALERQCLMGRECYVSSLRITLMVCMVALALSTWAIIRDGRRQPEGGR
ncbi:major facilitator superfamily domain-containing protein [Pisolithus thermaeus]|nr:major facilitator superfamily domain-containing protein [Pisolithus thermaeus]